MTSFGERRVVSLCHLVAELRLDMEPDLQVLLIYQRENDGNRITDGALCGHLGECNYIPRIFNFSLYTTILPCL